MRVDLQPYDTVLSGRENIFLGSLDHGVGFLTELVLVVPVAIIVLIQFWHILALVVLLVHVIIGELGHPSGLLPVLGYAVSLRLFSEPILAQKFIQVFRHLVQYVIVDGLVRELVLQDIDQMQQQLLRLWIRLDLGFEHIVVEVVVLE